MTNMRRKKKKVSKESGKQAGLFSVHPHSVALCLKALVFSTDLVSAQEHDNDFIKLREERKGRGNKNRGGKNSVHRRGPI